MKRKLLFIQLPIPRLTITCEDHNIPVAAYYLQTYLQEQAVAEHLNIQLFDSFLQNYGSDETILQEIKKNSPDIVCFSLFCWNVERSLFLAEQIKQHIESDTIPFILAGGPEVTPDNALLHNSAIDLYVYGEGEQTLTSILETCLAAPDVRQTLSALPEHLPGTMCGKSGKFRVNPPQQQAIDINVSTSAYLKELVPRNNWNEMFFETIRGCPFSCRFCYYNKNCGAIRFLDRPKVLELVQYAIDQQYREIFLLDPSFNIRPDLKELLKQIAESNPNRQVKIATELRADMIDEQLAQLLADAGVYEVELGLQSIHADTMKQIGRTQNLQKFLRGTRAMLERGIETKVDLIIGLPGDNLEKFKESARWVKREGLDDYLQVFCLSVLPGTYFRTHTDDFGLKFSPFPPYYLQSSYDWSEDEIKEAFSWAEDYFGMTFEPDIDDKFSLTPALNSEIQEVIYIDPARPFALPSMTSSITKWVVGPITYAEDLFSHLPEIQRYTQKNPYGIYHVYLELQNEILLDAILDFYTGFKSLRRQFVDRDFSVLSIHDAPLFHYRLEIFIKSHMSSQFSKSYLDTLQQHFYVEVIEDE